MSQPNESENEKQQSQSRPASPAQAENRPDSDSSQQAQSRPASPAKDRPSEGPESDSNQAQQASASRPASQASNKLNTSRPTSQMSNRPPSQASNKAKQFQSRTSSPSVSRPPPRTPRGRSRTPRSLSSASSFRDDEDAGDADRSPTPPAHNAEPEELPDVNEEEGEGDHAVAFQDQDNGKDKDQEGGEKKKRRRRGKKGLKGFGVNAWPHGDNPGRMEPPHGVDDWPYDTDSEGVGTSGRRLQRPKGVRDFSPAYAPSDAGESVATDYSSVSGLSLGDWDRSSLPGVDTWPYGDNPGIMIKPLDHWGNPLKNPDGTLMQKENPTGLPTYDELRDMDLDTHEDHVIKLRLDLNIDVAVEINARIHGDVTLALLM